MLEDESFNEFHTKIADLRNSMINLGKKSFRFKTHQKDS
jgi:hypothetical protein